MKIEIPTTGEPCTRCGNGDGNPIHDGICNGCYTDEFLANLKDDKNVLAPEQIDSSTSAEERLKSTIVHKEKKYSGYAITGFVLSLLSILGFGLLGIIGFILGIVALTQIKHTHEKGKGLSIAAIIIGFIWSFGVGVLRRLAEEGY